MKTIILLGLLFTASGPLTHAAQLTESTVTEIIKDVNLLPFGARTAAPAKMNALVKAPDRIRTGAASRAELTAPDKTITRVGANTVFSFEGRDRSVNLESGSLLFQSPKGKGGGTIRSGGASAAVLGTTLIVSSVAGGGFKVVLLEGTGRATLPNGRSRRLKAGQLVFVLPGGVDFSDVLDINLGKLVAGSQLVGGFSKELPSRPLINKAVQKQDKDLANGRATDTGVKADDYAAGRMPGNGLAAMDHVSHGAAVPSPLTPEQIFQLGGGGQAGGASGGPGGAGIAPIKRIR
jgi:hypothetical protein